MKKKHSSLYLQVIICIVLGAMLGHFAPEIGRNMKPFADGFIKLIKFLVGPIIFCSIVHGIGSLTSMRDAGRIGGKALIYFTAMSCVALAIGMVVTNLVQPGTGMHVDASTLNSSAVPIALPNAPHGIVEFLLHLIPTTIVEPFAGGDILQLVILSILVACALVAMGPQGEPITKAIDRVAQLFFTLMAFVMRLAPLGAFGAMAFTVGQYGLASLLPLGTLLLCFYLTCALFIFVALALVMRSVNLSFIRLLVYLRDEILITFGTSSSESALPRLLVKLEALGCSRPVVGMVLPTGYSFNLGGTAIYLSLAAIFLAQATDTPMSLGDQIALLGIMLLTSKGAAGVTGAGFVTLSATLATVGHIPVASLALILGIDRFMSEGRAVTNVIGNAVATIFVAHWEKGLDHAQAKKILAGEPPA